MSTDDEESNALHRPVEEGVWRGQRADRRMARVPYPFPFLGKHQELRGSESEKAHCLNHRMSPGLVPKQLCAFRL